MRINMARSTMKQYCIISSFSFLLSLRIVRRTERLSRSRDANMQLKMPAIRTYSSFIESKHAAGITTAIVYSTPSHRLQQYHKTAIALKWLGTLLHFIFAHQHPSSQQGIESITTIIQSQIHFIPVEITHY